MQPLLHNLRGVLDRVLQRTLPDDRHAPSEVAKHCGMTCVPVDVSLEFLLPEIGVCLWGSGIPTVFVPVPKAAMNEYYGPVFWEHQIGRTGQISYVKLVPESPSKQKGPKRSFWPSIFPTNARHHATTLRGSRNPHWFMSALHFDMMSIASL